MFERFIYGLFSNSGYKTVYTSQAKKLLKKESIEQLQNLRLKKGQTTDTVTLHFPSEDVITRSYLQLTNDVHGRTGIINHTLIMRTTDFFHEFPEVLDAAFSLIQGQLNVDLASPPSSLEPLKVETNV